MGTRENLSKEEKKRQLRIAAETLYDDYVNDPELIIFTTALAAEPFITDYVEII
jgi:hypothetical protein